MAVEVNVDHGSVCQHHQFTMDRCFVCQKLKIECGCPIILPSNYMLPDPSLTTEGINAFRNSNLKSLLHRKKLHLVLDLDHTLVHTLQGHKMTLEEKEFLKSKNGLSHEGNGFSDQYMDQDRVNVMMVRPGAYTFLRKVSALFDLSVYTMGGREYGQKVAEILDQTENGSLFKSVVGREDCTTAKQKALDVVLSDERVVLIVDDTTEVWEESCRANLIKIAPYNFSTKDMNYSSCMLRDHEGDEAMDVELSRVFRTLRIVHCLFYTKKSVLDNGDYQFTDVRQVLERVRTGFCS